MLTLFTTPKPFTGHYEVIQRNALRSWKALGPGFQVILMGNEPGAAQVAGELGLRHLPDIPRNEYGTPLLSGLFALAQARSDTPYLCYINADMLMLSDFRGALQQVARRKSRFLMVGQRCNFDQTTLLDFSGDWEADFRGRVQERGKLDRPTAIDYFVFRRGMWGEIPPFAIGRTAFDNWLIYRARSLHIPVVDVTQGVLAVHQNHDYNHTPGIAPGTKAYKWIWDGPEARHNRALAGGRGSSFTIWDATHVLDAAGLHPRKPDTGLGGGIWSYRRSTNLAV